MIYFTSIEQTGAASWRFTWAATTGPYTIYLDGELIESTTDTEYTYTGSTSAPDLEVADANETTIYNVEYPARAAIQWRGVSGAEYYLVQENVSGTWTTRARVKENNSGYYKFTSRALEDVTSHSFRVYAVDTYGNQSSALSFTFFAVRVPPAPDVSIDYNESTDQVEVTAS